MRKINKILLAFILAIFIIPIVSVNAETLNVKTVNGSINGNKISVSGTTDNGVLAVAIMIYAENGTELVTMQTTSVDSNNTFSDDIIVTAGKKYVIKVANYDGGIYLTKNVEEVKKENEDGTNGEKDNIEKNEETKQTENKEDDTTNTEPANKVDNTTNPKTGDNITMLISIFSIATLGVFTTLKINKNRRVRKH